MESELAVRTETTMQNFAQDVLKTLSESGIIPRGMPEANVKLFASVCRETKLSPVRRQIYAVPRKAADGAVRYTIQTGIDGYRAIAARTGLCAGIDDYAFDEGMTEYEHIKTKKGVPPTTATVTVYKMVGGQRCPFSATARWEEYLPKNEREQFQWKRMPYLMLGKCAEALALRKCFPEELSGVYTGEEMAQAEVAEEPKTAKATAKETPKPEPKTPTVITPEPIDAELNPTPDDPKNELTPEEAAAMFGGDVEEVKKEPEIPEGYQTLVVEQCKAWPSDNPKQIFIKSGGKDYSKFANKDSTIYEPGTVLICKITQSKGKNKKGEEKIFNNIIDIHGEA